jgi:acetolactate synthase I/II/III large subunit
MTGAGVLLDILNGFGVEHIFCSPGSEWPPVWEELAQRQAKGEQTPEYWNVRHEEAAVAMASGYAKATGRLPAVLIHTTAGTLNASMAMRAAMHEEIPMLVCAGESIDFGESPEFDPGGQWVRYLADKGGPARLAESFSKWSFGINSKAILASSVHRACQIAMAPPRGPVFLSIPFEFLFAESASALPGAYPPPSRSPAPGHLIDEAAQLFASARRPLIITDAAGLDPAAPGMLVELAELLAAPVVESTRQMYFNFPRDHPLHAGVDPKSYLSDADAVFLVGAPAPWHPPSAGPANAKVVALDVNPLRTNLPYSGYRTDVLLSGDISLTLAILLDRVRKHVEVDRSPRRDRMEDLQQRHERQRAEWRQQALAAKDAYPIDPHWFCHVLNEVLPDNAILLEETITHRVPIMRLMERTGPGRYYGAESGGLGLGMGMALGMKCAAPERPVVTLIGDGTFNYNPVIAALGFSQEYKMPTTTIIMNNAGYLSMKRGITNLYPQGWAARSNTFFGAAITPNPRYAALAAAFDAHGETVEGPAEIAPALRRAFDAERSGQAALVDVRLAPDG